MIGTYIPEDLDNYKKILQLTKAHKEKYGKGQKIIRTGIKYITIISHLFPPTKTSKPRHLTVGHGLNKVVNTNSSIEYVYWDSINQLINRLRLLFSSKLSGNTSVNNEIVSIISELREAGIIE